MFGSVDGIVVGDRHQIHAAPLQSPINGFRIVVALAAETMKSRDVAHTRMPRMDMQIASHASLYPAIRYSQLNCGKNIRDRKCTYQRGLRTAFPAGAAVAEYKPNANRAETRARSEPRKRSDPTAPRGDNMRWRSPDAPVAQLDRAIGFEPIGREFESLRAHQNCNSIMSQTGHQ